MRRACARTRVASVCVYVYVRAYVARARVRFVQRYVIYASQRKPTRSASPRQFPRPRRESAFVCHLEPTVHPRSTIRSRTVARCQVEASGRTIRARGESAAPGPRCDYPQRRCEQVEGASSGPRAQPIFFYSMEGPCNLCCEYRLWANIRLSPPIGPPGTRQQVRDRRGRRGLPGRASLGSAFPDPLATFREVMRGRNFSCNFWLHPSCTKLFPCLSLPGFVFFSFFL